MLIEIPLRYGCQTDATTDQSRIPDHNAERGLGSPRGGSTLKQRHRKGGRDKDAIRKEPARSACPNG